MDQQKTGRFIATCRKKNGLTQRQLADKVGVSDKAVSKWECGNGLPEVSLMLPLCEILGVSVNELLSGEKIEASEYKN
ncbi:MAG: helix-turn-helix domain-containing protein, partial [Christensenellales bacterium]